MMSEDVFVSEKFLVEATEYCTTNILRYLLSCLKNAGLVVQVTHKDGRTILSIRCTFNELCRQAEHVRLLKEVFSEVKVRTFLRRDAAKFKHYDEKTNFFTHAQQVLLIEHILDNNVRYSHDEFIKLGVNDIALQSRSIVEACMSSEPPLVEKCVPKHSGVETNLLWNKARNLFVVPYQRIRSYYGEGIALYFTFISYAAHALLPMAVLGVIMHVYGMPKVGQGGRRRAENPYMPIYGVLMSLWGLLFLKGWKRKENKLALEWGTYDIGEANTVRHDFFGVSKENPVTGKPEIYYSAYLRGVCYLISFLLTLPLLLLSVGAMVIFLNLGGFVQKKNSAIYVARLIRHSRSGRMFSDDNKYHGWIVPIVAYCLYVHIVNRIYRKIAIFCSEMENHKKESDWKSSMLIKRVLFELFTYFTPFLLILYPCNGLLIRAAYVRFFIAVTLRRFITDSLYPYLKAKLLDIFVRRETGNEPGEGKIGLRLLENMDKPVYDHCDGFVDFVIMISSIVLLAPLNPLGAALTVVSLFIKARSDLFRLLFLFRRDVPRRAKNITPWTTILTVIVLISIFLNCYLIACWSDQLQVWIPSLYQRWLPDTRERTRFQQKLGNFTMFGKKWCSTKRCLVKPLHSKYVTGIMIASEHFLLLVAFFCHMFVSDSPKHVSVEIARRKYVLEEDQKLLAHAEVLTNAMSASLQLQDEDLQGEDDEELDQDTDTDIERKELDNLTDPKELYYLTDPNDKEHLEVLEDLEYLWDLEDLKNLKETRSENSRGNDSNSLESSNRPDFTQEQAINNEETYHLNDSDKEDDIQEFQELDETLNWSYDGIDEDNYNDDDESHDDSHDTSDDDDDDNDDVESSDSDDDDRSSYDGTDDVDSISTDNNDSDSDTDDIIDDDDGESEVNSENDSDYGTHGVEDQDSIRRR